MEKNSEILFQLRKDAIDILERVMYRKTSKVFDSKDDKIDKALKEDKHLGAYFKMLSSLDEGLLELTSIIEKDKDSKELPVQPVLRTDDVLSINGYVINNEYSKEITDKITKEISEEVQDIKDEFGKLIKRVKTSVETSQIQTIIEPYL